MESTSPAASPVLPSSAVRLRPRSSTPAPFLLLRLARRLLLFLLAYGVPGVITSSQTYFYAQTKDPSYPFGRALLMHLPPWWYWGLATPFILALGQGKYGVTDVFVYGGILSVGSALEYHRRSLVPSLILQPLVENAIKHGLATRSGAGRVELRASREGTRLVLEVLDDGPGLAPGWDSHGGCIGVANVRARLHQLYGDRHTFTLENRPGGGVRARMELPFQSASAEVPVP